MGKKKKKKKKKFHSHEYDVFHNYRKGKRGGGVSKFTKDTYRFALKNLEVSDGDFYIVAEICYPIINKSMNVCGIYRPLRKL